MTGLERIRCVVNLEEPDVVPFFEQGVSPTLLKSLFGEHLKTYDCGDGQYEMYRDYVRYGREYVVRRMAEADVKLCERMKFDLLRVRTVPVWDEKPRQVNKYTFRVGENWSQYYIKYCPESGMFSRFETPEDRLGMKAVELIVESLEKPDPDRIEEMYDAYRIVYDEIGDTVALCGYGGIGIPVHPVWLKAVYIRPELVERYLDYQLMYSMEHVRISARLGASLILGGGDLADNHGPIYPPKIYRSFVLPRLRKLMEFCHSYGLRYIYRTDGNVWSLFDMWFKEAGVDGYGEIDAGAGMKLSEIKEKYPEVIVWGNVNCGETLVSGNLEDVVREVTDNIYGAAPFCGYIFGSSNTLHMGVKPENVRVMIETYIHIRSYPLKRLVGV